MPFTVPQYTHLNILHQPNPFTANITSHRLNLTVANCVYLLEPQWNPMVEHQAIARVLRLGQKRNVKIVRYIMKGTVEEVRVSPHLQDVGDRKLTMMTE